MGLHVDKNGVLTLDGKPYRGMGVNYFDCFFKTLGNPEDKSYRAGFKILAENDIRLVRFMACGFWPNDNKLYFENKEQYFKLMDNVIKCAEEYKLGLIPSLFWHISTVPDMMGEPLNQWGNPSSKTHDFIRQYTREMVTRYKDSPAIWGWEFGNEFNLQADLPNASDYRPAIVPDLGTALSRGKADELSHDMIRTAFAEFAKEVRCYDTYRIITAGNSAPRPTAWNQKKHLDWAQDTEEQYAEMLIGDNPFPMDVPGIHVYPDDVKNDRFGKPGDVKRLLEVSMKASERRGRVLFVGEFGAGGGDLSPEDTKSLFFTILDAVVKTKVPISAVWSFNPNQEDGSWNTFNKERMYQFDAIVKANREMGK